MCDLIFVKSMFLETLCVYCPDFPPRHMCTLCSSRSVFSIENSGPPHAQKAEAIMERDLKQCIGIELGTPVK